MTNQTTTSEPVKEICRFCQEPDCIFNWTARCWHGLSFVFINPSIVMTKTKTTIYDDNIIIETMELKEDKTIFTSYFGTGQPHIGTAEDFKTLFNALQKLDTNILIKHNIFIEKQNEDVI